MEFEFVTNALKAVEQEDGKLILAGIAATTDVDLQNETGFARCYSRMAKSAIGLPVVINSHNHEVADEIGTIIDATAGWWQVAHHR